LPLRLPWETLIGAELQWRQRPAGLRTTVLVAIGAAAFSDLGLRLASADGATRIVAYVVSGIGFLGAGVILKDGTSIRGLNTASTLWCSGSVGAFCGCGVSAEATALAAFILAGNTLLRPLVNYINRRPISEHVTEAQYIVHALCDPEDVSDVRDILFSNLEVAHYPIGDIQTLSESDEVVELAAAFIPTNAKPFELDLVVAKLEKDAVIKSATWTVATTS
jgi:putative Mg2+ transporter-C (MgtC) family protein